MFLGPDEYWAFATPRYTGSFETKLRFHFTGKGIDLVSNEFEESINPEQFSERQPYPPGNIMDPYFEVPSSQ